MCKDAPLPLHRSIEGAELPLLEEAYRVKDSDRLRRLLKSERWSYRLLARQLGVAKATIGKYVAGQRRIPPARALQIAEVLKVDPADLFVREVSTTVGATGNEDRRPEGD
jgi:transcriptional regulator with XRE-family HTH domain